MDLLIKNTCEDAAVLCYRWYWSLHVIPNIFSQYNQYVMAALPMIKRLNDYIVAYAAMFHISNNGTVTIEKNKASEINNLVDTYADLFLINYGPNPPKIVIRALGRGQVQNLNLMKRDAALVFQAATMVYKSCTTMLIVAQFNILMPAPNVDMVLGKQQVKIVFEEETADEMEVAVVASAQEAEDFKNQ
jgi:hypothetical protein